MSIERVETIPTLPPRQSAGHKGDYGTVLVLAGGRGLAGAAALVGAGALRSGAGRVRIACPAEVQATVAQYEPSYMTWPLPQDDEGMIAFPEARPQIEKFVATSTVMASGPGLGQTEGLRAMMRWVVESVPLPAVLDADAVNNLVDQTELLGKLTRPVVLTPHPGEFARLVGKSTREVQADRETLAVEFAGRFERVVLVLKGAETIVTDGRRVYVNTSGNPGMATGGSGDILGGVIAAIIGQGLPAFEAAQLGVYAHGLAGDIARDQDGEVGMIAGDIVDSLADAFVHLSS